MLCIAGAPAAATVLLSRQTPSLFLRVVEISFTLSWESLIIAILYVAYGFLVLQGGLAKPFQRHKSAMPNWRKNPASMKGHASGFRPWHSVVTLLWDAVHVVYFPVPLCPLSAIS